MNRIDLSNDCDHYCKNSCRYENAFPPDVPCDLSHDFVPLFATMLSTLNSLQLNPFCGGAREAVAILLIGIDLIEHEKSTNMPKISVHQKTEFAMPNIYGVGLLCMCISSYSSFNCIRESSVSRSVVTNYHVLHLCHYADLFITL